ncbi:fimbrial protein [Serratia inhibens]|uniref:Fimbrial protein n=1 Tax=Serratia inhibens TaxID=2338073 RepID=A0AA92X2S2_9GAMM|nr:fimbrial protein [Serratia inhibens]RJF55026.1 fimbrial protein [Serratia inhibens]
MATSAHVFSGENISIDERLGAQVMRKVIFSLLILTLLSPVTGFAGCILSSVKDARLNLGNIYVDPNAAVGSVLFARVITLPTSGLIGLCYNSSAYEAVMTGAFSTPNADFPAVYESGVPGLGLRVRDIIDESKSLPIVRSLPPSDYAIIVKSIKVEFIKTGNITSGSVNSGNIASFSVANLTNRLQTFLTLSVRGGIITRKTCWAKQPTTINVPLGNFSSSDFPAIGSTTPAKIFTIDLLCDDNKTPVYISIDPLGGYSPDSGILTIEPGEGVANGVAVKLTYENGANVIFGSEKTYYGASDNRLIIPLRAQYIRRGGVVTPGAANTAITFTITQN